MGWEAWATIGVVVLVLYALATNKAGPDVILLGGMTILMSLSLVPGSKLPGPEVMARSFGNEALLTVAVLFVVAAGLSETGGLSLITERLLGRPKSIRDAQVRMMLPVAASSAFLNNTPVVAMFMPVVNDWCKRTGLSPSKLFIPLSYAAVFGGMCTLIGTSTNLVVRGMMQQTQAQDPSMPMLGFWTLGAVGLPAGIIGLLYVLFFSRWLLPDRKTAMASMQDPRQYTVEMMVQPGSAVDGQTVEAAGLRSLPGAYLVEIERDGESIVAVGPEQILRGHDRLIFVGVVESVVDLQRIRGLAPATNQVFKLTEPRPNRRLVEAVVSPACPIVGMSIREGCFRTRYDAAVIAVHRNGERVARKIGDIVLQPGDTLLLETHPRFTRVHRDSRDFFLVSTVAGSQPRRHEKAWVAIAILIGMIAAMSLEPRLRELNLSVFNIALVAAGLMVLTRCCSAEHARRSIDWQTLLAIGAAFGIGKAMESSGAAAALASGMMSMVGKLGPWGVLAGIYLLALLFTEVVTNNAAAVLSFPIAHAAAQSLGVNFMPFAVAIALAASAGFATPLGYQTHLMVYGPGGYRFSDYLRIGLPLDLLIMAVAVALTPVFFPF